MALIEIDASEFPSDELIYELESRGEWPEDDPAICDAELIDLCDVYQLDRDKFDQIIKDIFYRELGKIL